MDHHHAHQPDFGTGQKKLGVYLIGLVSCIILTILAFWIVMSNEFSKWEIISVIYAAACVQFIVQVVCFLRLNTQTEQGKMNVMAFLFTGVILLSVVFGSIWIMWNMAYYMT